MMTDEVETGDELLIIIHFLEVYTVRPRKKEAHKSSYFFWKLK